MNPDKIYLRVLRGAAMLWHRFRAWRSKHVSFTWNPDGTIDFTGFENIRISQVGTEGGYTQINIEASALMPDNCLLLIDKEV